MSAICPECGWAGGSHAASCSKPQVSERTASDLAADLATLAAYIESKGDGGTAVMGLLDRVEAQVDTLTRENERLFRENNNLGNALAQERSRPEGSFDQWSRLQAAEARCAQLQRQLDAVDAHLPPWETEPGSDVGCVGRVQTILNLKADRGRCARLQQALTKIEAILKRRRDRQTTGPLRALNIARNALQGDPERHVRAFLAGPDTPAIPPRPPIQPPGHQREMADTPADSPEDKT